METKRRVSFRIIIQTKTREKYISFKKKRTTKNRTHHTPTQEYVVPKSIPIAGPSDLDMFVCVVVVCVLSNFL
jgi:hypothetical protein